jgi:hypothetical protein
VSPASLEPAIASIQRCANTLQVHHTGPDIRSTRTAKVTPSVDTVCSHKDGPDTERETADCSDCGHEDQSENPVKSAGCESEGRDQAAVMDMLVFGLGNFSSCVIARYQLALILALRDRWRVI